MIIQANLSKTTVDIFDLLIRHEELISLCAQDDQYGPNLIDNLFDFKIND